jgi:hypothetical protein
VGVQPNEPDTRLLDRGCRHSNENVGAHHFEGEHMTEEDDDIQDYKRPWVWLSDADIRETIDSICQYTGDYDEWLCKKIERKIRSINNG